MNPDGSSVMRVTYNVASSVGHPAWSPDGGRIAFNCEVQSGNSDVCVINTDGSGFVRLTNDPASDIGPTWSPDVDANSNLYVLQHATGTPPLCPSLTCDGALYRIDKGLLGSGCNWKLATSVPTGDTRLIRPTAVIVGPDSALYVSNHGLGCGAGDVLRIEIEP